MVETYTECPFCKNNCIRLYYRESCLKFKRSNAAGRTKMVPVSSKEKCEILVDKCPNCGKSKKEIENALKHGKELSKDEIIKRLRDAGLDPTKLK